MCVKRLNLPPSILVWSWRLEEMGQPGKVSEDESPWRLAHPPPRCQPHAAARQRGISRATAEALQCSPQGPVFRGAPQRSFCFTTDLSLSEHCRHQCTSLLITWEVEWNDRASGFRKFWGPSPGILSKGEQGLGPKVNLRLASFPAAAPGLSLSSWFLLTRTGEGAGPDEVMAQKRTR